MKSPRDIVVRDSKGLLLTTLSRGQVFDKHDHSQQLIQSPPEQVALCLTNAKYSHIRDRQKRLQQGKISVEWLVPSTARELKLLG